MPHSYAGLGGGFQQMYRGLEHLAREPEHFSSPSLDSELEHIRPYHSSLSHQDLNYAATIGRGYSEVFTSHVKADYQFLLSSDKTDQVKAYKNSLQAYSLFHPQRNYNFIADNFLKPGKEGAFVGDAEEIKEFIEAAFEKMFGSSFPNDIKISVLEEKKFRKVASSPATLGLSINRRKQGLLSEIFVLNDHLARVMLTIGHELGHVLTETLSPAQDEEAKAYAFSLAWMKVIKEHNIANLADAIVLENPAKNGLHNVAFAFVQKLLDGGGKALEVYQQLVKKELKVNVVI